MFGQSGGQFDSEEDAHHEEPWLISYADMMTLLFGFFVLMYVFAEQGSSSASIRENLAKYFGGQYAESTTFSKLADEFKKKVGESDVLKDIEVKVSPEGVTFTFRSTVLFNSGRAKLLPKADKALSVLASLITGVDEEIGVIVEGHTDDVPISQPPFFSNWELSGARAGSVLRLFESQGFSRKSMIGRAYADTRPSFPTESLQGDELLSTRAKNRRVVIHVYKLGSWSGRARQNNE